MAQPGKSPIIGIDLGTSRCVVAVIDGLQPKVITTAGGIAGVPSAVAFLGGRQVLVGAPALNQRALNPGRTVYGAKRLMGRRFEEMAFVDAAFPYPLCRTESGLIGIVVGDRVVAPEQVAALILATLKRQAEDYLGEPVTRAVITVPAYFNDAQRQATKDAGEIAGLKVERIINEPTAAALAYGLENKKNAKIAVFDLGGGTFNVSILDIGDGVVEVLGTAGDPEAGGEALTDRLARHVAAEFARRTGVSLEVDLNAMQRIRDLAETAKVGLSSLHEVTLRIPAVASSGGQWIDLEVVVTRADFECCCADVFERLAGPCEKALADAKLKSSDIDEVVMVGGSIRVPKVQELAKTIFHTDNLDNSINPDEVVAIGAAIQGGVLVGDVKNVVLLDITAHSLGVRTIGGVMTRLIDRNSLIPTFNRKIFATTVAGKDSATIVVLQGDGQMAADNVVLGCIDVSGIGLDEDGHAKIEIEFSVECDGAVSISATDRRSGARRVLRISNRARHLPAELDRIKSEHAEMTAGW